jgi:hypothetical protein
LSVFLSGKPGPVHFGLEPSLMLLIGLIVAVGPFRC